MLTQLVKFKGISRWAPEFIEGLDAFRLAWHQHLVWHRTGHQVHRTRRQCAVSPIHANGAIELYWHMALALLKACEKTMVGDWIFYVSFEELLHFILWLWYYVSGSRLQKLVVSVCVSEFVILTSKSRLYYVSKKSAVTMCLRSPRKIIFAVL